MTRSRFGARATSTTARSNSSRSSCQRYAPDLRLRTPSLIKGYDALFREHDLFAGRDQEQAEMDAFIAQRSKGHLFITGRSASGKTALLVNWVRPLLDREDFHVVYHFLSLKEGTATEEQMLRSLVEQLLAIYDYSETVPVSLDALRVLYAKLVEETTLNRPLIVAVDGLDEVEASVPWQLAFSGRALERRLSRVLGARYC